MKDHRVKIVVEKNHKINYFVKAKPAPRVSCHGKLNMPRREISYYSSTIKVVSF